MPEEENTPNSELHRRSYEQCPKFHYHDLSKEQMVEIATLAVTMAREEFYLEVGKTVFDKMLWLLGVASVGLYMWFQSHDLFKG
jgi:hypothetical protein